MSQVKAAYENKQLVIDEIKEKLTRAKSIVVVDYMGTTVSEADGLRSKLREADIDYTVYKNTLVKRAIKGTEYEELGDVLAGPSAFAISYGDETAPARVINDSIKELKKMAFKAGVIGGMICDAAQVEKIASIPSRDVLLAKFMGSIQSPISKAVRTLSAIAEAKAEGSETPAAEAKEEAAPAVEATVETPVAEAKEEAAPAVEATVETPVAEAKEEAAPAVEATVETPAAEAKEEATPAVDKAE